MGSAKHQWRQAGAVLPSLAMPVVDAHVHLFGAEQRARRALIGESDAAFAAIYGSEKAVMATADDLVATLEHDGLDRAVAVGFAFAGQQEIDAQNAALSEGAARYPGRIVSLATINLALPEWRQKAEQALRSGARGFGELRPRDQGWDPLGGASRELCELAASAGAVLLWHVSEPAGHAYPGKTGGISPVGLVTLATAQPRTRMVAAHLGGGISFYLQMPEVRQALVNVWFDTAAAALLYDDTSVARLVDLAGPGRVLFGSDYPLLSPRHQLRRLQAVLPDDVARAVCGENAETLFGTA